MPVMYAKMLEESLAFLIVNGSESGMVGGVLEI